MRYLVRWEHRGAIHECFANTHNAAYTVYYALLQFFDQDGIPISIWKGAELLVESKS